jgi:LmbE family N-acetylglucosaminyl deacetylase
MLKTSAFAAAAAGFSVNGEEPQRDQKREKVIVTGGHPGDPEYGCGGTIAELANHGCDVVLLYLNEGEPEGFAASHPNQPKGTRVAEARKACEILKARPAFAKQIDGSAIVDRAHYEEFRAMLEAEKPAAVFTHWPIDNHADHRAISMLTYDAWIRMGKSFALFYYEVSNGEDTQQFTPHIYVDITKTEPLKRAACYAHATQNPGKYYAMQDTTARWRGIESGHTRAEAFVRLIQGPDFPLGAFSRASG